MTNSKGIRITERLYAHLSKEKGRRQIENPGENISMGDVAEELILGKRKK